MRADWERNFKMLIQLGPSKVWEMKICVWIGCSSTLHRSYNLRSSCHHFISVPSQFQFVELLLFFCQLFKLD